jgi:hypothetical protein
VPDMWELLTQGSTIEEGDAFDHMSAQGGGESVVLQAPRSFRVKLAAIRGSASLDDIKLSSHFDSLNTTVNISTVNATVKIDE